MALSIQSVLPARRVLLLLLLGARCMLYGSARSASSPKLRFGKDGIFSIVQLTDLHYGEDAFHDLRTDLVSHLVMP
jgi:hypothetical protein